MLKKLLGPLLCFAFLFVTPAILADEVWSGFRGPNGQGIAPQQNTPTKFDKDSVVWKVGVPGQGWSSPVVAEGRIWITAATTKPATAEETDKALRGDRLRQIKEVAGSITLYALCYDFETGKQLKEVLLAEFDDPDPINPLNTYASPTPVLSDGRLYCHFGDYGTWCLDAKSGEQVWQSRVRLKHSVGPGSSPFLIDDKLILVCDGTDKQFIAALDRYTGNELWRTSRPSIRATDPEYQKAYSTPVTVTVAGKEQLVIPGAQWICAYDPNTGNEIWRIDHGSGFSVSPSPIVCDGLVVFSTGYMRPELVAVRPDGQGDVTDTHVVWRVKRGAPTMPSPVFAGGHIYCVSDGGVLSVLSPKDGEMLYQKRLGGKYSASPIAVGDKIYFSSQSGEMIVLQAGEEYREIARNMLEPRLMASPAAVENQLIVRTEESLLRIGKS